jgi:hypothetical protein
MLELFWIFISLGPVNAMYFLDGFMSLPHTSVTSIELWATMIGLLVVTQSMLVITYDKAATKYFLGIE